MFPEHMMKPRLETEEVFYQFLSSVAKKTVLEPYAYNHDEDYEIEIIFVTECIGHTQGLALLFDANGICEIFNKSHIGLFMTALVEAKNNEALISFRLSHKDIHLRTDECIRKLKGMECNL